MNDEMTIAELRIPKSLRNLHAFDWATRATVTLDWRDEVCLTIHTRVKSHYVLHEQLRLGRIKRIGLSAAGDTLDVIARDADGAFCGVLLSVPWDEPAAITLLEHILRRERTTLALMLAYSRRNHRALATKKIGIDPESGPFPAPWSDYQGMPVLDIPLEPVSEYFAAQAAGLADTVAFNNEAIRDGGYEAMPPEQRGFPLGFGYGE